MVGQSQCKIEYPPTAEPGMSRLEWERALLNPWRQRQKRKLRAARGPVCEREGCSCRATDLDEGIIPRSAMRGLSLTKRRLAFGSFNLFLLCARCNREEAHREAWAFEQACARYGEAEVCAWYAGIGLRAPRYDFMLRENE